MGYTRRHLGWLLLIACILSQSSTAQVRLGEASMGLSGDAQGGFSTNWGDDQISSHAFDFGFNTLLNGYYYNPKFLSFSVNPYYNQSRQNSNFNSIFGSSGILAGANLFSDSWHPVSFGFTKDWNSQHQYNVPGSLIPYYANGSDQSFTVAGGLNRPNLPTFNANYGQGHSEFNVLGVSNAGVSRWRSYGLSSSYSLLGVGLGASYGKIHTEQNLGSLNTDSSDLTDVTDSSVFTVNATRQLWGSTQLSGSYSRNSLETDYAGLPSNGAFNTYNAFLSARPLSAMSANFFINYTDNLYNYLLQNFLPGPLAGIATPGGPASATSASAATPVSGPPLTYVPASTSSNYLSYGTRVAYQFNNYWNASGGVDHRVQNYVGTSSESTDTWAGTSYSHPLAGGHYGVNASFSTAFADNGGPTMGYGVGGNYGRRVAGWEGSVGAQYSHSQATSILTNTSSGYGFNVAASRKLFESWRFSTTALIGKSSINGLSQSDTTIENLGASLSSNHFSFAGNYSTSSGTSLLTANGLTPLPPDLPSLNNLLYSGHSYSMSAGYRPNWHWQTTVTYGYAQYGTNNLTTLNNTKTSQLNVRTEYDFRQMRFIAGYSRISQGVGTTFNSPRKVNALFVGISRHFDLF